VPEWRPPGKKRTHASACAPRLAPCRTTKRQRRLTVQAMPSSRRRASGAQIQDERFDRRRVLIATGLLAMGQSLLPAMLFFSGLLRVWHVACLAVLLGVATAFEMSARQAFAINAVSFGPVIVGLVLSQPRATEGATGRVAKVVAGHGGVGVRVRCARALDVDAPSRRERGAPAAPQSSDASASSTACVVE